MRAGLAVIARERVDEGKAAGDLPCAPSDLIQRLDAVDVHPLADLVRDADTLQRELRPLLSIRDHYPKYILTMDDDPEEQYDGIRRINARDWLLGLTD